MLSIAFSNIFIELTDIFEEVHIHIKPSENEEIPYAPRPLVKYCCNYRNKLQNRKQGVFE